MNEAGGTLNYSESQLTTVGRSQSTCDCSEKIEKRQSLHNNRCARNPKSLRQAFARGDETKKYGDRRVEFFDAIFQTKIVKH